MLALPPFSLLTMTVPLNVPPPRLLTTGVTTMMSPSKLTLSHDVVLLSTDRRPRSLKLPNPMFEARAAWVPGLGRLGVERNSIVLGEMPSRGGGLVTAKVTLIVALPPFALLTVTVAVWFPPGTFAGCAPTLMLEPETVASSQPLAVRPYVMLAMVIAPRLPLPEFEIATVCRGGDEEDPETPENDSDVGESTSRGGWLTAKLAVNVALPPFALLTVTVAV